MLRGDLTDRQATAALEECVELELRRFAAEGLRSRSWELWHTLAVCDATDVALAEATAATALLTTDPRIARAPGLACRVVGV